MKVSERLVGVVRLFLDTAPLVYYVEANPHYLAYVDPVFDGLDAGALVAVTSPVTLAECLIHPLRTKQANLQHAFTNFIVSGNNMTFVVLNDEIASKAADLRARYNLTLTDAFQVATALFAGCDAFLTNDAILKRVIELPILILDEFDPG